MRAAAAMLTAVAVLAPSPQARATGNCENLSSDFSLVAVSESKRILLYEGTEEHCDDESGESESLELAQARTFDGDVAEVFLLEEIDAEQRERVLDSAGLDEPGSEADYRKYAAKGFVPVDELDESGACKLHVETRRGNDYNGFPAGSVKVELRVAGAKEPLWKESFDDFAIEDGQLSSTLLFLPTRRLVLLELTIPKCEGGPPAGYFGEDDPGECYLEDDLVREIIAVSKNPAGAACFTVTAGGTDPDAGSTSDVAANVLTDAALSTGDAHPSASADAGPAAPSTDAGVAPPAAKPPTPAPVATTEAPAAPTPPAAPTTTPPQTAPEAGAGCSCRAGTGSRDHSGGPLGLALIGAVLGLRARDRGRARR